MLLFITIFFQSQAPLDNQVLSMSLYSFIFNPWIMYLTPSEWMSDNGLTSFRWAWERRFERTGWHARIGRQAGKKRLDLLCSNGGRVRLRSLCTEWPGGGEIPGAPICFSVLPALCGIHLLYALALLSVLTCLLRPRGNCTYQSGSFSKDTTNPFNCKQFECWA